MQDIETIEQDIKNAWIAGLFSSVITLFAALFVLKTGFLGLINALLGFSLTFGVYKKSRVAALVMLIYFTISHIMITMERGFSISTIIAITFIYYFYKGVRATFNYHS